MYKQILVHTDDDDGALHQVKAAIDIASRFEAHLIGLGTIPDIVIPTYAEVQIGANIIDASMKAARDSARTTNNKMKALADEKGLSSEWLVEEGQVLELINRRSRYADLLVIAQADSSEGMNPRSGIIDHLTLSAGTPVLMIPYVGIQRSIGKRVMIAWSESKETARAVKNAVDFLESADEVHLVNVQRKKKKADPQTFDVLNGYLQHHGVEVQHHDLVRTDLSVADTLINWGNDHGIDLLVMGAYGHHRMRELVLGGVSEYLLRHSPIPILLAH